MKIISKLITGLAASLLIVSNVSAGSVTIPNTFSSGTPAVAAEVNQNFSAVATAVNDNDSRVTGIETQTQNIETGCPTGQAMRAVDTAGVITCENVVTGGTIYDYHNYIAASNLTEKVFALTNNCGDTATWTYSRTAQGSDTRVVRTQVRTNVGVNCKYQTNTFLVTATTYEWRQNDRYDNAGTVIQNSYIFNSPIPRMTSSMSRGLPWGEATNSTATAELIVEKISLLGVEDITVTAGVFTNCLKIHTLRTRMAAGSFSRISWHCLNVGEVKRIDGVSGGNVKSWDLTSYTTI